MRTSKRIAPRLVGWTVLALSLTTGLACSDRKAKERELARDERRVTVDSKRDATKPVVDEAYRFRIDHPGKGWKTLDHVEARKTNPERCATSIACALSLVRVRRMLRVTHVTAGRLLTVCPVPVNHGGGVSLSSSRRCSSLSCPPSRTRCTTS